MIGFQNFEYEIDWSRGLSYQVMSQDLCPSKVMEPDVAWWILWSLLGGATVEVNLYATFGLRSFSLKHLISAQTFKISFIFASLGVRSPWAENSIITKVAWLLKSNVPPVGGANSEFFVLVLHFCADCSLFADQKSLKQRKNEFEIWF